MGAAGVLIADDRCVCTDQECRSIQDAERAAAPCQRYVSDTCVGGLGYSLT